METQPLPATDQCPGVNQFRNLSTGELLFCQHQNTMSSTCTRTFHSWYEW
jgi:hypothetical protein